MKKFTFMLLAALMAVASYAAGPKRQFTGQPFAPAKVALQLQQMNAKPAPEGLALKAFNASAKKMRAPKKAATGTTLSGDYTWDYVQAPGTTLQLDTMETITGSARVKISATEREDSVILSGLVVGLNDVYALTGTDAEAGDYIAIPQQVAYVHSQVGNCSITGFFYYEGDETYEAGWYYGSTIYGFVGADGVITLGDTFINVVVDEGVYAGATLLKNYFAPSSTLTPIEKLDVEFNPYVMTFSDYDGNPSSLPVKVAVNGDQVYFQGFSTYVEDAYIVGTKDAEGNVTFAGEQSLGSYGSYACWFQDEDAVFAYDAETDTYSTDGLVYTYLVSGSSAYYDGYFQAPVIKPVVEIAATPADPAITSLTEGNYGWYIIFDIPVVDVDGNGMVPEKLSYKLYTDIDGEVAPLTFTPATHTYLTEEMTEIPYGFTEEYDFYSTQIYLNDLFSEDWDKIGIQSIYRGGGEENMTEIQWFEIEKEEPVSNLLEWVAAEQDYGNAQAITEFKISETINATVAKGEGSTDPAYYDSGTALRLYANNTLTITSEEPMVKIEFTFTGSAKQMLLEADKGEYALEEKLGTWTGEENEVTFTVPAGSGNQARIQKIVIYLAGGEEPDPVEPAEAIDPDGLTFNFDDGTLQGWTLIDADGDGYNWAITPSGVTPRGGEGYAVYSQSYNSEAGALTPDNYLVSPKFKLGAPMKFYAVAQDATYPEEHFAVAVSVAGNTDAADFTNVEEWTLTASRVDKVKMNARGMFRSPKKVQGTWYEYTVDLSEFEGQEGYVAIRHFGVTDMFYMVVDDISFGSSEFEIVPAEGTVESLNDFTLTFNKYEVAIVDGEAAQAELYKDDNFDEPFATASLTLAGTVLSFSFDEITEPGAYTLLIPDGTLKNVSEEKVLGDLEFHYTIAEPLVLVELPEGVEAEEYTLEAVGRDGQSSLNIAGTKLVAFDGNDVYLQGLAYYFPEAFVKGTLTEDGQVLVPSGQYVGTDSYGDEFLVALDVDGEGYLIDAESGVIAFDYDAESGVMTLVEDTYYGESGTKDAEGLYNYFETAVYTPGAYVLPDVVELPEDAEVNTWYLSAYDSEDTFVNREVGVAFVDNDIYVQGMCDYLPEAWVKGTIDAEAGTATFATGQFYGTYYDTYNLFFVGYGEDVEDVVFTYDAENGLLTTEYDIYLAGDQKGNKLYDLYYEVEISRDRPETFPVVAPEGLETETYLFAANVVEEAVEARRAEASADVTFDFNAMEVPTSSGSGASAVTDGDITEARTLTAGDVTLTVSPKEESSSTENRFWGTNNGPQLRVYSGTLTFEVPEGCSMTQIVFNNAKWSDGNSADSGEFDGATWTGDAQTVVVTIAGNTQINNIVVTVEGESSVVPETPEKGYTYQVQVGFDGNDVYFSGLNSNCAEYWMKGTLSEDGKTVTIPSSQYMGGFSYWGYVFDYYITAMDENGYMTDVVLNYDAEKATFTTDQTVVLNGSKFDWDPYQTFIDVEITKLADFAATPADPIFESCDLTKDAGYNKIYASIPTKDVDGNDLLTSKLYYIVWFEKDGTEQAYTFTTDLYDMDFEEDVTEVPYNHDGYDIYAGGEIIYLEDDPDELATWTKVGIQSVYYGGGERNVSNIVWCAEENLTTGIVNVKNENSKNAVIFDLQGRRVVTPTKGLYIVNGRKVVK